MKKKASKRITDKAVQATENAEVVARINRTAMVKEPDNDAPQDSGMTLRQETFVKYYTGKHFGNATQSAIAAGYRESSARETASELLTKPDIRSAVRRALARKHRDADRVVDELTAIAFDDFNKFVTIREDGRPIVDWVGAARCGALGSIRKMKFDPVTGDPIFEMHDRVRALEVLAKIHGLVRERHEVTGPGGSPIQVEAVRATLSNPRAFALAVEFARVIEESKPAALPEPIAAEAVPVPSAEASKS
jgi:phage terminase small subunit